MSERIRGWQGLILLAFSIQAGMAATLATRCLERAHAHNDYEHARPLFEALEQGFGSIEADIHLVGEKLLVAHDRLAVSETKTLEAMYLEPLQKIVLEHGGSVYGDKRPIILLIDVKGAAEPTYSRLRDVLQPYAGMLTRFKNGAVQTNAVTVIITGNRARAMMESEPDRLAGFDGRLEDLTPKLKPSFIPLVSDDWSPVFRWRGVGPFPDQERLKLKAFVEQAHGLGARIRFWGAPDRKEVWEEFYSAGVDLLNADDLAGLAGFLRSKERQF